MSTLTTNGLEVSPHFPTSEYESINSRVQKHWSTHNLYNHFSGSWNALAYRFHGTVHSGENFVASLKKYGTAPTPFERYLQEQALFVFFGGAFSALESLFYGSFAIGAFLNSPAFPLDTPRDQQRVSPSQTIA